MSLTKSKSPGEAAGGAGVGEAGFEVGERDAGLTVGYFGALVLDDRVEYRASPLLRSGGGAGGGGVSHW